MGILKQLTVIIPAYNEVTRLGPTLQEVLAYGNHCFEDFQVVVVDDGSTDGTADLVRRDYRKGVLLVQRAARGGKGIAIRDGLPHALHPWVLFLDADHAISIEEIEQFAPATEEFKILIGSKRMPQSQSGLPLHRRWAGALGQLVIRSFVIRGFHDTQCGFKLLHRDHALALFQQQRIHGFGFDFEMLFLARRFGYPILEIPVHCRHAADGSVRLGSYAAVLLEIGKLCWHRLLGHYPRQGYLG